MRAAHLLGAAVLAAFACVACGRSPVVARTTTTSGGVPSTATDDAQIAEILRAAFTAVVDESQVGALQASDPQVVRYARILDAEYSRARDEERGVLERIHVTPEVSDESRQIAFDSKATMEDLARRQGSDLERSFLAREITFQRRLLDVIDYELLPSVRSEAQRAEVLRIRPMVRATLAEASNLQDLLLTRP
jgi:hypothetical protein